MGWRGCSEAAQWLETIQCNTRLKPEGEAEDAPKASQTKLLCVHMSNGGRAYRGLVTTLQSFSTLHHPRDVSRRHWSTHRVLSSILSALRGSFNKWWENAIKRVSLLVQKKLRFMHSFFSSYTFSINFLKTPSYSCPGFEVG